MTKYSVQFVHGDGLVFEAGDIDFKNITSAYISFDKLFINMRNVLYIRKIPENPYESLDLKTGELKHKSDHKDPEPSDVRPIDATFLHKKMHILDASGLDEIERFERPEKEGEAK